MDDQCRLRPPEPLAPVGRALSTPLVPDCHLDVRPGSHGDSALGDYHRHGLRPGVVDVPCVAVAKPPHGSDECPLDRPWQPGTSPGLSPLAPVGPGKVAVVDGTGYMAAWTGDRTGGSAGRNSGTASSAFSLRTWPRSRGTRTGRCRHHDDGRRLCWLAGGDRGVLRQCLSGTAAGPRAHHSTRQSDDAIRAIAGTGLGPDTLRLPLDRALYAPAVLRCNDDGTSGRSWSGSFAVYQFRATVDAWAGDGGGTGPTRRTVNLHPRASARVAARRGKKPAATVRDAKHIFVTGLPGTNRGTSGPRNREPQLRSPSTRTDISRNGPRCFLPS